MRIINVTEHEIRVRSNKENREPVADLTDVIYEPSGIIARVSARSVVIGEANGYPIVKTVFGAPTHRLPGDTEDRPGLPDEVPGVLYVGSTLLAQAAAQLGRTDIVAPNTAPRQDVRLEGHTYAVFGFQQF